MANAAPRSANNNEASVSAWLCGCSRRMRDAGRTLFVLAGLVAFEAVSQLAHGVVLRTPLHSLHQCCRHVGHVALLHLHVSPVKQHPSRSEQKL